MTFLINVSFEKGILLNSNLCSKTAIIDVVIPIFNEEAVLPILFSALDETFSSTRLNAARLQMHYIFVDDGSRDRSVILIKEFIRVNCNATLIRLSRNFGHQAAVSAGLATSTADATVIIDADLQDPPEVIYDFVKKWKEGNDIVSGIRSKREGSIIKRIGYWLFYRTLRFLTDTDIPLDAGDFSLISKRARNTINSLPENQRVLRILRSWVGFNCAEVRYHRPDRVDGDSKYNYKALYRLATDGIASASTRPLGVAQIFAIVYFILNLVLLAGIAAIMMNKQLELDFVGIILLGGGVLSCMTGFVILFSLYVISAYLKRMYLEAKGRPSYVIMEKINASDK